MINNLTIVVGIAIFSFMLIGPLVLQTQQAYGKDAYGQVYDEGREDKNMKSIEFNHGELKLAGNLYFPDGFDANQKYPAIVTVHPGGGVKEQVAGLYAQKLSEQGFVTLAFDASHQGASEGIPRYLDDPMKRVADVYSAIDYLNTLDYVDPNRIGILGACAGSGTAVKAATTDTALRSSPQ